jgi:hypothetical protein
MEGKGRGSTVQPPLAGDLELLEPSAFRPVRRRSRAASDHCVSFTAVDGDGLPQVREDGRSRGMGQRHPDGGAQQPDYRRHWSPRAMAGGEGGEVMEP